MKLLPLCVVMLLLSVTPVLGMERFLEAPVIPQAQVMEKTDSRLVLKSNKKFDEVLAFYKKSLEGLKDIKVRHWPDAVYIEDDGNLPWHSITIYRPKAQGAPGVIVKIRKDSWTWILGTLVLRYVGVFAVLVVILICMSVSGKIISRKFQSKAQ